MRYLRKKDDGYLYVLTSYLEDWAREHSDEFEIVELDEPQCAEKKETETSEEAVSDSMEDVVDLVIESSKKRKGR